MRPLRKEIPVKRESTKETVKGLIGIAVAIGGHFLVKKVIKVDERIDRYFDEKEASPEDNQPA